MNSSSYKITFSNFESITSTSHVNTETELNIPDENILSSKYQAHNSPDTSMLFFIIIAMFIGASTRHLLKKIPIPFTALLLIFGIVLGVLTRIGAFETWGTVDVSFISNSFESAAHFDPHLLLYIFLPILVFEAAFAMDLHTFKKSAVNAVILAVPGIVIALVLSATMVYLLDYFNFGLPGWANWSLALMFGSVISATDPVAVVALLKDLGASKKLSTLIEGESLLNDGTAIVIFMVFFGFISGDINETNGFAQFMIVSFGGIGIGTFIGWLMTRWISNVFNDSMVEITIVVAATYLTFYLAEHFMHVSGVLALVSLGIMLGGYGKSSISPKVEHFMHQFWELAGFIANCLIFLIVGLVIASRTEFTANDFLMLGIVYVGIHVIRAITITVLYPFMKNTGYGLPVKDAVVVWYGALRGAIGLALALIVVGIDSQAMADSMNLTVKEAVIVKNQFLFLTAGIVTLTLIINATTIKALVSYLGLLDISPAKAEMNYKANMLLHDTSEKKIKKLNNDRYLKNANWEEVRKYIPTIPQHKENQQIASEIIPLADKRIKLLEKEKSVYWNRFTQGMLSPESVLVLIENVAEMMDQNGNLSLADRQDLEESWQSPRWLIKLSKKGILKSWAHDMLTKQMIRSYDSSVSFIDAQDACLALLKSFAINEGVSANELHLLEEEVNQNKLQGQVFVRNLRKNHPIIYGKIATLQATRSILYYEEKTIERLKSKGLIDDGEAQKMNQNLAERTKKMRNKCV